jgi:hypothetical protein
MANQKKKEKSVDVPPTGARNPDPMTDAPGSHPVETGVGAALGGAAAGAAAGAVGGPVGAVAGAIVGGAVAGGLLGKGVGELIDPTTENEWLDDYYKTTKTHPKGATRETYRPAYQYGIRSASEFSGKRFDDVEDDLRGGWDDEAMSWENARPAVRHAWDRWSTYDKKRAVGSTTSGSVCPPGTGDKKR